MDITKTIKKILLEEDMQQQDLAGQVGYTKQGFNNLLAKNDFKVATLIEIANAMGYDLSITFTSKKSGEKIECK